MVCPCCLFPSLSLPPTWRQILAVAKTQWPECTSRKLSAVQCKNLIDAEVLDMNTENDRFIRTIVVGKRNVNDELSNSIVIFMDDYDRVLGRDGDGMIYYDFEWEGSGTEATSYQQRKIPPIIAEETTTDITPDSVDVNVVPVRTLGGTTNDVMNGYVSDPIAGGVRIHATAASTIEGTTHLQEALAEEVTIEAAGTRSIGPFNCTGMTGNDCCLMIKHKVRDR